MKFAVIGNPIDKSLSPQLHEILYKKLNILNCSFEKIHLEHDQLDDFLIMILVYLMVLMLRYHSKVE